MVTMGKLFERHCMTTDTLFLVVTCTLENSRMLALEEVVKNLRSMPDQSFLDDLILFDNASTMKESDELVSSYFKHVFKSDANVGFWSAIQWVLDNYKDLLDRDYKYLYVIESDMIHTSDAFQRLEHCERFLETHDDVGLIRVEEFSVANRHLYDKRDHRPDSRRYAWVVQDNFIQKKRIEFQVADEEARIFTCNFLAKVPTVTRIDTMKQVFAKLATLEGFSETAFQQYYYEHFQKNALLDDGIFHSKLGNDNNVTLKGSYVGDEGRKVGYRETRSDRIIAVPEGTVKRFS